MSNLIKSGRVISLEDLKRLENARKFELPPQNISSNPDIGEGESSIDVETQSMRDRILQDAEQAARQIVEASQETARQLVADARSEADDWWRERRAEDSQVAEEARQSGYDQGYKEGIGQAERDLAKQWDARLNEANAIVRQAYITKDNTIAEAERFLVELSCAITEKIILAKVAEAPEMAVNMFARALARRKEQGVITLCVSPSQFGFVQAAKEELMLVIDSQAELQIVPDASIKDGGCIVRSAFGSIDARIDTQLDAIREELLRVAAQAREEESGDGAP
ncbi:FliH/SctL family protein [Cohnella faecalis]|uniref:Flagellar assembly protein FliH n=1 Tax=Cohnella faecalis TaxID=2315694 RepID=A0A398CW86_9BACL|nr:FliH/SctL family protein [Cohnella faecalis]RIE03284.1 flagellar assembly protein FliH [Cohnella faecalis]